MVKRILVTSFITIMLLLCYGNVSAKTCSAVMPAPWMAQVSPVVRGDTQHLQTAYSSCQGKNTEVWFKNIRSMPDEWKLASGTLYMDLYEEDPVGNQDEHVKQYIGNVVNKTITTIYLNRTLITGNIDSEGDQSCELYMTFLSSGTYGQYINKTLFDYQICMN